MIKKIAAENDWEIFSEQSDTRLWKLLTNKNAKETYNSDQTDSGDDIEASVILKLV